MNSFEVATVRSAIGKTRLIPAQRVGGDNAKATRNDRAPLIRRADLKDAVQIADLFQVVYRNSSHPFQTLEDVRRFLSDSLNFQIVAEDEGRIVASMAMTYYAWNDAYELGRALTHPDYRCHGLAAFLAQKVVNQVCDRALGSVFFGFPRVRRIVELCAALSPPMIVVGHDAGQNVADGSRETHLIICAIPRHSRFIHVSPPLAEVERSPFVQEHIYGPLGLRRAPGHYPPLCFVGTVQNNSVEVGQFLLGYDRGSPSQALQILNDRSGPRVPVEVCRELELVLRAFPEVQHVTATILADKIDLIHQLCDTDFEIVAYLPAWYKLGCSRYDCVQLARRTYAVQPIVQGFDDILDNVEAELGSIFGARNVRQASVGAAGSSV